MVAANRPKTHERHEICRKATWLLKKYYSRSLPKWELPVLDALLYAICLENCDVDRADALYAELRKRYPDLNEARVSSITELQHVFADCPDAAWRAMRVKSTLQHVFEENYAFELENLRRKTLDLALRHLQKISGLTPFVRNFVMQNCLGSHVLPLDDRMHRALRWVGLVESDSPPEQAADSLRPLIRKSDAATFCHLVRCLANDPKRAGVFEHSASPQTPETDPVARLELLLRKGPAAFQRKTAKSSNHKDKKPKPRNQHRKKT